MDKFVKGILIGIVIGAVGGFLVCWTVDNGSGDGVVQQAEVTTEGYTISRIGEKGSGDEELTTRFSHDEHGFALLLPSALEAKRFREGAGAETVVFQKPGEQEGFQIFITPYEEDVITEERFVKDAPSGVMENAQEILIGAEMQIRALTFVSENNIIGETREVWFIRDGHLYEITTYASQGPWLSGILETLRFNE